MKTAQETFSEIIKSTSSYLSISEAMSAALDVLMNENDEINTSFVDCALYDENQKHGLKSSDTLRGRRARHIIKSYILELVIATIKEEILKNGEFRIPENDKNDDGIFNEEIIYRFEIQDFACLKDEFDDYAFFDISLKGTLRDAFEAQGCQNIEFCVIFDADRFSDFFEITDISDVEKSIRKIEMRRDYDIPVEKLEALADQLLTNRNKHLLLHAIKCPKSEIK